MVFLFQQISGGDPRWKFHGRASGGQVERRSVPRLKIARTVDVDPREFWDSWGPFCQLAKIPEEYLPFRFPALFRERTSDCQRKVLQVEPRDPYLLSGTPADRWPRGSWFRAVTLQRAVVM